MKQEQHTFTRIGMDHGTSNEPDRIDFKCWLVRLKFNPWAKSKKTNLLDDR